MSLFLCIFIFPIKIYIVSRDGVDVSKPEATPLFKLKPTEPIDYKNKGYDKFQSLPKTDLTVDKGVIFIIK